MTSDPVSDRARVPAGEIHASSPLTRWAVGIAATVAALLVLTGAIFAVAYARGGSAGFSDNWVGFLGAVAIIGGLIASLAAFVLAIVARVKHEKWAWLWLPLSVFPALLVFVVLGEVFWWE